MNFSNSYSKRVKVLWQRIQVKITNETRNLSPYLLQISDILIIMDRMFIFYGKVLPPDNFGTAG